MCKQRGKSKLPECVSKKQEEILCPYFKRLAEAKESPITLFNFKSFLFQANYARQFGKRELLIIDEAHNTESQLMDFVAINISDRDFVEDDLVFPELSSPEEYLAYFESIGLSALINSYFKQERAAGNIAGQEKWEELRLRYEGFVNSIEHHQFISEYRIQRKTKGSKPYSVVTLKPLFVRQYAEEMLFS